MIRKLMTIAACAVAALGQQPAAAPVPAPAAGAQGVDLERVLKHVDDVMWHFKLGDIAEIDKIEYTSAPPARHVPGSRRCRHPARSRGRACVPGGAACRTGGP